MSTKNASSDSRTALRLDAARLPHEPVSSVPTSRDVTTANKSDGITRRLQEDHLNAASVQDEPMCSVPETVYEVTVCPSNMGANHCGAPAAKKMRRKGNSMDTAKIQDEESSRAQTSDDLITAKPIDEGTSQLGEATEQQHHRRRQLEVRVAAWLADVPKCADKINSHAYVDACSTALASTLTFWSKASRPPLGSSSAVRPDP